MWGFEVESPPFLTLSAGCFLGFLAHYFNPLAWKKHAFISISLLVAVAVLVQWQPHPILRLGTFFPTLMFLGFVVTVGLALYGWAPSSFVSLKTFRSSKVFSPSHTP